MISLQRFCGFDQTRICQTHSGFRLSKSGQSRILPDLLLCHYSDRKASIIAHKQTVPRQHRYGTLIDTYARDMQDLVFARCH